MAVDDQLARRGQVPRRNLDGVLEPPTGDAATALPLLYFAKGAQKIPLSLLGFLQYISPTLTLILGVFVYKEHFSKIQLLSFAFIWSALAIYSLSKTKLFTQRAVKLEKENSAAL